MTRRQILAGGLALVAGPAAVSAGLPGPVDDPAAWRAPTRYVECDDPRIRQLAARVTGAAATDRDKALALFGHVRDAIPFGFARGFWNQTATEVLAAGRGFCNTKSTLFVTLLRAAGIPARQVFVALSAEVLAGLVDPGTAWVDHSYVEVWLDGAWRATDAYIVDQRLFGPAQAQIQGEGRVLGLGVHATGTTLWNGRDPAFAQYNILDPRPIGRRHWGPFADVDDFYARAEGTENRLNGLMRGAFGLLTMAANRRADRLRSTS